MSKSFAQVLQEWKEDNKYAIGEDIGWEFADYYEAGPTPADCSLTENGTENPTEEVVD